MIRRLSSLGCAGPIVMMLALILPEAVAQVVPPGGPGGPRQPPGRRPPRGRATMPDDGICRTCFFPPNFIAPVPPQQPACWHLVDGLVNGADCDWVQIPVNPGRRYRMSFCNGGGSSADTVLRLFDSSCNALAANDDACAGGLSEITWDAVAGDIWRLQIANAQLSSPDPSDYDLCVSDLGPDPCDSCAVPNPTDLFPTQACQFVSDATGPTEACNTDFYRVFLEAGATYRFSTCPLPAPAPPAPTCPGSALQAAGACNPAAQWNPRIEIWRAGGCAFGSELTMGAIGNGGCPSNATLPDFMFTPPATGFYTLGIGRENPGASPALCSNHGSYTLAYQRF